MQKAANLTNIESAFPLSPMQSSMLFYSQTRQDEADVLFNQASIVVEGELRQNVFEQAWSYVFKKHDALRTGFVWDGLKQTQQIVLKSIELPLQFIDISAQNAKQQEQAIAEYKKRDKQQGFDFTQAPLMRLAVFIQAENKALLLWSSHHLVMDRWCIGIIFEDLITAYDAFCEQKTPPASKKAPFKRYIGWLHTQNDNASQEFWKQQLTGLKTETRLCERSPNSAAAQFQSKFDEPLVEQIKALCKELRMTMPVFLQSIWALTLQQIVNQQDIVFGLVVSGRSAQIRDVEKIVGSFVNNQAIRMQLDGSMVLREWLKQNQLTSFQRVVHEHQSLIDLHAYSDLHGDEQLFDHILVWQDSTDLPDSQYLSLKPEASQLHTAFPLTLSFEEKHGQVILSAVLQKGWRLRTDAPIFDSYAEILSTMLAANLDDNLHTIFKLPKASDTVIDAHELVQQHNISNTASNTDVMTHNPNAYMPNDSAEIASGRTRLSQEMVEDFLLRAWKHILELEDIGLDDDFFHLGGNSLKAAQLVKRLEQMEQKHIPLLSLFKARTIRSMASVYLHTNWAIKPEWIIPVHTKAQGVPIFYIASPEVNTLGYLQLALELAPEFSGYIVQSPPQSHAIRQVRSSEIPDLSRQYLSEIKKIQHKGPYQIVGMCTGGQIAAEIVRQLEAESAEIGFVGIINTWAWYTTTKLYHFEKAVDFYRMLRYYTKRITNLSWQEVKEHIQKKLGSNVQDSQTNQSNSSAVEPQSVAQYDTTVTHTDEDGWYGERPDTLAMINHPITIFTLQRSPYWRTKSASQGWDKMAQTVAVVELKESDHEEILREHNISDFAKRFKKAFAKSVASGSKKETQQ